MRAALALLEGNDAAGAKCARMLQSPSPSDASLANADLEGTCRKGGLCVKFNKGACPEDNEVPVQAPVRNMANPRPIARRAPPRASTRDTREGSMHVYAKCPTCR
jgi:hypothetical protein